MVRLIAGIWRTLGRPYPLVITSDRRLTAEEADAIREKFTAAFSGASPRPEVIVMSSSLRIARVYTFRWLLAANVLGVVLGILVGWLAK